ncbi:hypothetical protein [Olsenella sp. Marseille-P4559]|uniref:hypothetical protein n=1 Tax=Olsenella sp. Marseille-P4559 TaxID=2364795 RepID=UPI00103209F6|nr:hypothetical protein [Olsenella sp. Marseille-P4559]
MGGFYADAEALERFSRRLDDDVDSLQEKAGAASDSVMSLADSGNVGETQYAFLEHFNDWVGCSQDVQDRVAFLSTLLECMVDSVDGLCDAQAAVAFAVDGGAPSGRAVELHDDGGWPESQARSVRDGDLWALTGGVRDVVERFDSLSCGVPTDACDALAELLQGTQDASGRLADLSDAVGALRSAVNGFEDCYSSSVSGVGGEDFDAGGAAEGLVTTLQGYLADATTVNGAVDSKAWISRIGLLAENGAFGSGGMPERFEAVMRAKDLVGEHFEIGGNAAGVYGTAIEDGRPWGRVEGVTGKLAVGLAVVGAGLDACAEYDRNPYLPDGVRAADAAAAVATDAASFGVGMAVGIVAGAAVTFGAPVAIGVAVAVGGGVLADWFLTGTPPLAESDGYGCWRNESPANGIRDVFRGVLS